MRQNHKYRRHVMTYGQQIWLLIKLNFYFLGTIWAVSTHKSDKEDYIIKAETCLRYFKIKGGFR